MKDVWIALGLTLLAGMATGIGSIIAFTVKRTNYRFLSVATGFSAGVMLYISFVEIFNESGKFLVQQYGDRLGSWVNVLSFFGGMLLIGLIDNLIPAAENPHETHSEAETRPLQNPQAPLPNFHKPIEGEPEREEGFHNHSAETHRLMRIGSFTALAIAIHNFPEGLATFFTTLQSPNIGMLVAFAIALHNIPEGISVSVPIFYATGDRKRAFLYSVLSGLAEPLGGSIAYLSLHFFVGEGGVFPPQITGILLSGVAGIMVYISLDELLPTSRAYGKGHDSLFGLVAGMLLMALSLLCMK